MFRARPAAKSTAWVLLFEFQAYRSLLYESLFFISFNTVRQHANLASETVIWCPETSSQGRIHKFKKIRSRTTNFVAPQLRVKSMASNAPLHAAIYYNYLGSSWSSRECNRATTSNSRTSVVYNHKCSEPGRRPSQLRGYEQPAVNRQPGYRWGDS